MGYDAILTILNPDTNAVILLMPFFLLNSIQGEQWVAAGAGVGGGILRVLRKAVSSNRLRLQAQLSCFLTRNHLPSLTLSASSIKLVL